MKTALVVGIMDVEHATGSALRRRQRRLRQWLRHERMTVAVALAECQHHAAPRGQSMARARRRARDVLHGHALDDAPPRAASTLYFSLDDDVGVLAARPDRLYEVRPQERVLRRTVEQNVGVFTYPLLDVLEPQMGDQLVEVLRKIDTRSSHQAIEVPKVFPDSAPLRRVESRPPQLAEQLVEVPTNPGYALAVVASKVCSRRELRQIIAGLQGRGRGARGSLQGSLAGLDSAENLEQIVENPVHHVRREGGGSVQGSLPVQNSAAVVEQIVDIPARRVPD